MCCSQKLEMAQFKIDAKATLLSLLVIIITGIPYALSDCFCEGCGCKGGPGWRDSGGHCVSHKGLSKICGNPPGTKCTFEGATLVCPSERSPGVRKPESMFPK